MAKGTRKKRELRERREQQMNVDSTDMITAHDDTKPRESNANDSKMKDLWSYGVVSKTEGNKAEGKTEDTGASSYDCGTTQAADAKREYLPHQSDMFVFKTKSSRHQSRQHH